MLNTTTTPTPEKTGELVIIACTPKKNTNDVTEANLIKTLKQAVEVPIQPEEEILVPSSLISSETLKECCSRYVPEWLPAVFTDGTPSVAVDLVGDLKRPAILRKLNNGNFFFNFFFFILFFIFLYISILIF